MKSVTEFPNFTLTRAFAMKAALVAQGKPVEEVQQLLGQELKFEGDRLSHFIRAMEVVDGKLEDLRRVLVLSLNEGENAPAKAVKIEDHYYLPEHYQAAKPAATAEKGGRRGGKGGRGGGKRGDGPRSSPWGLTPEEKAAKGKGKQT